MDEVTLSQSSFYEDELPVNHSHLKPDPKVLTIKITSQKLEDGKPIPERENYPSYGCDFTVPIYDEQTCKSAEVENNKDTDNGTSISHFLSQESQTASSTGLAMPTKLQNRRDHSRNFSKVCGILMSSPCKRPRLLEHSHEDDQKDTRKSEAVQSKLYLEWDAHSQFESELMNKETVPAGWPAIGTKSVTREKKSSTLSFFTLVEQAGLLPREQLDEIKRHELNGLSGDCHRPSLRRSRTFQCASGSHAEKFHKIDPDMEEENPMKSRELYLQEEASHDCNFDHILADQEVPIKEANVDHSERPALRDETYELTREASTETESTLIREESNNGRISCAKPFCSKFADKNASTTESKDNAADSEETKQGLSLINNRTKIISDPSQTQEAMIARNEHVVPNIGCKFPFLPLKKTKETELCSSLRNIDERDRIDECLDDVDWSPLPSRNELLTTDVSSFYEQEEVQDLTGCVSLISDINYLQGLERISTSDPSHSKQTSCIECFNKVKVYGSQEHQPKDCTVDGLTTYQVHENLVFSTKEDNQTLENDEGNTRFKSGADPKDNRLQGTRKWEGMPVNSQKERSKSQQTMESTSDISGQEKDSYQEVLQTITDDLLRSNNDRENRDVSAENNHPGNKDIDESLGTKDENEIIHDYCEEASGELRAQIESGMLHLDGPELLQFAMILVQGALKKSQTVIDCGDSLQCQDEKKEFPRALPAFSWKSKLAYHGQNALDTSQDNKSSESAIEGSCVKNENSETSDCYHNEGPPLVRPLSSNSCNRPLRLGLSRKHSYKPLHPYFKKQ